MSKWNCSHCNAINPSGAYKCHNCPNTCGDEYWYTPEGKAAREANNPKDPLAAWPLNDEFFVEVEDHCEDGSWSGYAHSDEFPIGQDSKRAILLSKHTHLLAEAVREAKAQVYFEVYRRMAECDDYTAMDEMQIEYKEKASELRNGSDPENGGKDE